MSQPEAISNDYRPEQLPAVLGYTGYPGGQYVTRQSPPVCTLTRYRELPPNTVMFSWSDFPFKYATNGKCDEVTFGPILGEAIDPSITIEGCISFSDFTEILYVQVGENDEQPWVYLVKHKDGYYVCFDAWCDYTGFDCRGVIKIAYSRNRENMIQFGLEENMRDVMKSGVNYIIRDDTNDFLYVWKYEVEDDILALERDDNGWVALIPNGGSRTFTITNRSVSIPGMYFEWSDEIGWNPKMYYDQPFPADFVR